MERNALIRSAYTEYLNHTKDMAFVKDISGVYIDASLPFALMTGHTHPANLIGKTDFEIFQDEELAKRYTDDDARLFRGGISLEDYIEPMTTKDGRPRYCQTSKYILKDDNGKPMGILGISRDITAQYEAQLSYENELKNLFDPPSDTISLVLIDVASWRMVDTRLRRRSDHIISMYSTPDEYLRDAASTIVSDEAARDYFRAINAKTLQEQFSNGLRSQSMDYLRRMPDDTEKWVRSDFHLLLDPVNACLSLIILLRDIDLEKKEYAQLLHAAQRDPITELLNRDTALRLIKSHLASATGTQALFMIDLDNFKQVNDLFGHQYGDAILSQMSGAIQHTFRGSDIIGRIGGDEFMVLMKNVISREAVERKAGELISAMQFSTASDEHMLNLTTSVGVTLFTAGERDFRTLFSEADAALYQCKRNGKNRFCLYQNDSKALPADEPVFDNVNTIQLRTLLENMDGGVVLAEVTDRIRITYVSPSFYHSFGRDSSDETKSGQNILSLIYPDDQPGLNEALMRAGRDNDPVDYAYRVINSAGQPEWRRIRAKRIPDTGDGVARIVTVITDITSLRRANEQAREAEERYRIAVEQTDAMLWDVDVPAKTATLRGAAWAEFHREQHVFTHMPQGYIASGALHPDSEDAFRRMFADLFAGKDGEIYFFQMHSLSDEDAWVRVQFRIMRDEDGRIVSALGISQLISNINAEMHEFEQEMRFSEIVGDSLLGYIRANFTQNKLLYAHINGDAQYGRYAGMTCDEYLALAYEQYVDPKDQNDFHLQTSRETLISRYLERESWRFIDYRRIAPDHTSRWTSLFIKLMRHPISGDIYAFAYLRDNDARRHWELSFGQTLARNATLLLYTKESMEKLVRHILKSLPAGHRVTVSVIELMGLEQVRSSLGELEVGELLSTFGRLCRIAIRGNVVIGQLDENRVSILRTDGLNDAQERERVLDTIHLLKELIVQTHPNASISLVGGFSSGLSDRTSYHKLLTNAEIACRSAVQTMGEATVGYADTGVESPDPSDESELAQRFRALEIRYQQQSDMLRISQSDELTGVLNKASFYQRIRDVLRLEADTPHVILRFDINRFKVYNDVCGMTAGDRLLRTIATQLERAPETSGNCARLESDHFIMIVKDDPAAIDRSHALFSKWLGSYSPSSRLHFTTGVYRITDPSVDPSIMCERALLALRSAKSDFDSRIAYYSDALREKMLEEQQLINDMDEALRDGQFIVHFQPQINYDSHSIIGAEALVRWNHPVKGLMYPASFIALFEKNGLITKLDKYVWEKCCEYLSEWSRRYPQRGAMSLSVNMSRADIYDPKLCEYLTKLLKQYHVPASSLHLEITESAYMENPRQLIDAVSALRKAGFIVEMDDFGSGYSSLNTLKAVDVDILKLDMGFLSNCAQSARGGSILSSVIRMAHWLKLPIIAEGVEDQFHADYLKSLGCIYMQGYFFSRPIPSELFERMIAQARFTSADRYLNTNVQGAAAFWDPSTQMALLFNSFVGGAAIMEYHGDVLEITRANDAYYHTIGTTREAYIPHSTNVLSRFDEENKRIFKLELDRAISTGMESGCEVRTLPAEYIRAVWTRNRLRLLAKNGDSAILYIAIEDVTQRKLLEQERETELERTRILMKATGSCLLGYDFDDDTLSCQVYLPQQGMQTRTIEHFAAKLPESPVLMPEGKNALRELYKAAKAGHTSGELELRANLWDMGFRWWRLRYSTVEDERGNAYRIVAQGEDIQQSKDHDAMAQALRLKLPTSETVHPFNDDVVSQIFELFYNTSQIEKAIAMTLSILGEYYGVSRAYICEDLEGHTETQNTFIWVAPKAQSLTPFEPQIVYKELDGWERYQALYNEHGVLCVPSIHQLRKEIRRIFAKHGAKSLLQFAIRDNGQHVGMIGFDDCSQTRNWTDEQIGTLMIVSRIISLYLLQLRKASQAAFSKDFHAALDDNAAFIYIIDPMTNEIVYNNKAIHDYLGEDYIGKICYKEFLGKDSPCRLCPAKRLKEPAAKRLIQVKRPDGLRLLCQASPLHWNGREMVMLSCVDISSLENT